MSDLPQVVATSPRILALQQSGLLETSMADEFGHLIAHIRDVLDAPVAIVTLVDEDRQVFAGHSGLPEPWSSMGQTPISHSFCQYVVNNHELLVVTDATKDPDLRDNPAIGDLGVVAYLGIPLSLPTGEIVGAVAAIDTAARDWTEQDVARMSAIAVQAQKQIAIRISESRWRGLFETMQEGFYVARAVRDDAATLIDVIFEEANPAVSRLTDLPLDKFIGGYLSSLVPEALDEMLPVYDRVLTTGKPEVYANGVERMGRWFENRVRRIDDQRIASILTDVTAQYRAERSLEQSNLHWRGLFEQLHEGFMLGRVVRDADGQIIDWRYEEVNRAWGDIVGIPSEQVTGRTIREVFPGIADKEVMEFADVTRTGEPEVFVREIGTTGRWYEGRVQRLDHETFVVLYLEVTKRVEAEAALRLSEAQLATVVEGMPAGVLLATAPSGEIVMSNSRMNEILGRSPVAHGDGQDYSDFIAFLEDGAPFDPQNYPLSKIMAGKARNHTVEVDFERPDKSRLWIEIKGEGIFDANDTLLAATLIITDIEARKRAADELVMLNTELSHRMKNSLAMVQAIVSQSLRTANSAETGRTAILQRLEALSQAQDVLTKKSWQAVNIHDVVENAIAPHRTGEGRISLGGPSVDLSSQQSVGLSLAIHELATNAVKYGALSNSSGRVAMTWTFDAGDFTFTWTESGGPAVTLPENRGFGSRLIETIVASYFDAEGVITFRPTGIEFKLSGSIGAP